MKQKRMIFKLTEEGKKEKEIAMILHEQFGAEAYGRKTVYKWMAQARLGFGPEEEKNKPGPKLDEQLLLRIQEKLKESPFLSTRQLAEELNESPATVWRYLTIHLNLKYKLTRWIPHILNDYQKDKRITECIYLGTILKTSEKKNFYNIITGDESWFTFKYGTQGAWLSAEEDRPEMDGSKISIEKIMVTVIWGVHGIWIIDFLPQGASFNTTYYIDNILKPLNELRAQIWSESNKKRIWLHLDNCKVHNSKASEEKYVEYRFKRAPHPPYSPDVAPSDFFLFGYVKEKLKGHVYETRDELQEKIIEILLNISMEKRKEVFSSWIKRCDWVSQHGGSYYHKD